MKKVFLVYGHYNDKSFNFAIKDNFIKSARENGHSSHTLIIKICSKH